MDDISFVNRVYINDIHMYVTRNLRFITGPALRNAIIESMQGNHVNEIGHYGLKYIL